MYVRHQWFHQSYSLRELTKAGAIPFLVLSIAIWLFAGKSTARATRRFTLFGMAIALLIMVPLGIHCMKSIYNPDDSPPFADLQFWLLAALAAFVIFLSQSLLALICWAWRWDKAQSGRL